MSVIFVASCNNNRADPPMQPGFLTDVADRARGALAAGLLLIFFHGDPAGAFGFDDVAARAQSQAQRPYQSATASRPRSWRR